jgi:hypothetical protein
MAENEDFMKALASDFSDEEITENPTNTPPADDPKQDDPATPPASDDKVEEPKKDDPENPADPNKKDEEPENPPADPEKPTEEDSAKPKDPETPPTEEEQPKPLTEEGVLRLLNETRLNEQNETKVLQETYKEVLNAYHPDGLSNVLVDQSTGKELRTPQDVVDASGGDMTMEQAAQWLLNQQFELDQTIQNIQKQAAQITETTVNFKRDALAAVQKYDALFKAYPDLNLQEKAFNLMMQQVQADPEKGVILKAPDVIGLYDTYLEPYARAFEFSQSQPAAATPPADPATPPAPATPTINDRLDEGGDGGESPVDDPTNFAQQVTKELAGGL